MKCSFVHETMGNYMVIYGNSMVKNDYRNIMFKKNKLNRFLELKITYIDNKPQYYYEISSRQSLKHLSDCKQLIYDDVYSIISGIREAVSELGRYLLNAECIILEPDKIFLDPATMKAEFCYNPENNQEMQEGLRELFRFFLNVIDSSDKKTVEFTYEIYCKSMKENFSMDSLFTEDNEVNGGNVLETDGREDIFRDIESDYKRDKSIIEKLKEFINGFFKPDMSQVKNPEGCQSGKTDSDEYDYCETVLLEVSEFDYRIISADDGSVTQIMQFPYLVGKLQGKVNMAIDSEMVSRIHAKFIRKENNVYIMDMNSKNGTYINGIRIHTYEEKQLNPGDKVRFADMEYIYQQVH